MKLVVITGCLGFIGSHVTRKCLDLGWKVYGVDSITYASNPDLIDDVLCYRTSQEGKVEKYKTCKPIKEMIEICNQCHNAGHRIVIYTARGMTGFNGNVGAIYSNLFELTTEQLDEWGVKYHQLVMGKAHYDLLIDDKAVNSIRIKNIEDIQKELK